MRTKLEPTIVIHYTADKSQAGVYIYIYIYITE